MAFAIGKKGERNMLIMSQIHEICEASEMGEKVLQIAREYAADEKTVHKHLK